MLGSSCRGGAVSVQTIYPTVPAAGLSAVSRPNLTFTAQSVSVATGANWIQIDGVQGGAVFPPGVSGMTWPLDTPTTTPQITITAPPAGHAPIGPPLITVLTFTDAVLAPNPGVLATPQTVATIPQTTVVKTANPGESLYNLFTGLARGCALGLTPNGANELLSIYGADTAVWSSVYRVATSCRKPPAGTLTPWTPSICIPFCPRRDAHALRRERQIRPADC